MKSLSEGKKQILFVSLGHFFGNHFNHSVFLIFLQKILHIIRGISESSHHLLLISFVIFQMSLRARKAYIQILLAVRTEGVSGIRPYKSGKTEKGMNRRDALLPLQTILTDSMIY